MYRHPNKIQLSRGIVGGGQGENCSKKWTYYKLIPTSPPSLPMTIRDTVIKLCIMNKISS